MNTSIRTADSKGRVSLPGFANSTVIVEAVSDTEFRVRKAQVIPEDDLHFSEADMPVLLSEHDARNVLATLKSPPKPNVAARKAARRLGKKHG